MVLLLQSVILAGMTMTSSGSGNNVGRTGWSAASLSFVSSRRPASAPFFLASRKKRGLEGLLTADDIAVRREARTRQPLSVDMVAPAAGLEGSPAAQAYHERKREALSAWSEERQGRDLCERCRRARKVSRLYIGKQ